MMAGRMLAYQHRSLRYRQSGTSIMISESGMPGSWNLDHFAGRPGFLRGAIPAIRPDPDVRAGLKIDLSLALLSDTYIPAEIINVHIDNGL